MMAFSDLISNNAFPENIWNESSETIRYISDTAIYKGDILRKRFRKSSEKDIEYTFQNEN